MKMSVAVIERDPQSSGCGMAVSSVVAPSGGRRARGDSGHENVWRQNNMSPAKMVHPSSRSSLTRVTRSLYLRKYGPEEGGGGGGRRGRHVRHQ